MNADAKKENKTKTLSKLRETPFTYLNNCFCQSTSVLYRLMFKGGNRMMFQDFKVCNQLKCNGKEAAILKNDVFAETHRAITSKSRVGHFTAVTHWSSVCVFVHSNLAAIVNRCVTYVDVKGTDVYIQGQPYENA
jgi:hypothetical protein